MSPSEAEEREHLMGGRVHGTRHGLRVGVVALSVALIAGIYFLAPGLGLRRGAIPGAISSLSSLVDRGGGGGLHPETELMLAAMPGSTPGDKVLIATQGVLGGLCYFPPALLAAVTLDTTFDDKRGCFVDLRPLKQAGNPSPYVFQLTFSYADGSDETLFWEQRSDPTQGSIDGFRPRDTFTLESRFFFGLGQDLPPVGNLDLCLLDSSPVTGYQRNCVMSTREYAQDAQNRGIPGVHPKVAVAMKLFYFPPPPPPPAPPPPATPELQGPGSVWCAAYRSEAEVADGFGALWDPACMASPADGCMKTPAPAGCRLCNLLGFVDKSKHPEAYYAQTHCRCPLVASGVGAYRAVGRLAGIVGPGETPGTLNDFIKNPQKGGWFSRPIETPGQNRTQKPHEPGPVLSWYERSTGALNVMFDGLNCTSYEWAYLISNAINLTRNFVTDGVPLPSGQRRFNKYFPDLFYSAGDASCPLQPATEYFFDKEPVNAWNIDNFVGDNVLSRGRFDAHAPNCTDCP